MPRQTTLSSFQAAQRGDETSDPAPGFRSPAVPVPEQLRELVLQDDISGMPLGQVVGLVRMAVREKHINATESEIRDEAERRRAERADADASLGTAEGLELTPEEILAERHARGLHAGLTVGGCRTCAAVETVADDDALIGDPFDGLTPHPDGESPPIQADDTNAAMQLRALDVESQCTAEMSLSMIIKRVRESAWGHVNPAPTDAEIVAEAERIQASFDPRVAGPREYTVAADGTVADVRPAAMTPDRGPDAGTTIHQVGDEQRWSGGGAGDSTTSKLIPTDAAFNGKLYREAPELANIAEQLIQRHGFLDQLENCDIRWYWKRKTGVSKGRVKIGFMKRASDLLGHFSGADFIGWLSAMTARDANFTSAQIEAAVFHQLLHIDSDEKGNWIFAPHDFEGFAQEVRVYGTWTEGLKIGGKAFTAAHQMGLFDASDDEDSDDEDVDDGEVSGLDCRECGQALDLERPNSGGLCRPCQTAEEEDRGDERGDVLAKYRQVDDGSGVLIHDDGTPLTADEIAEMEAHELADDDMADPDQDYDDDDEDERPDLLAKHRPIDDDSAAAAASRADTDDDLVDLPL